MPSKKGMVSIHIDPDLHKKFKRVVSFRGDTIANAIQTVLTKYIDEFENRHRSAVDRYREMEAEMAALREQVQQAEENA